MGTPPTRPVLFCRANRRCSDADARFMFPTIVCHFGPRPLLRSGQPVRAPRVVEILTTYSSLEVKEGGKKKEMKSQP